jgi:alanine racemase
VVRGAAPDSKLMAVIKANAYGHGLERVTAALISAKTPPDAVAVARLDEARRLRALGVGLPIIVLEGCLNVEDLREAAGLNLDLVVHRSEQIEQLRMLRPSKPLRCWLKVDTGMHRLGFPPEEVDAAYRELADLPQVERQPGLMTHLANADDPHDDYSKQQLARFAVVAERTNAEVSIANSAGILAWPDSRGDWVRPGLMLYGVSPLKNTEAEALGLRPVMTLASSLLAIRTVKTGDAVGYGGIWTAPRDGRLGVVGIGYGDGYPREVDASASVLLNGRRAPIVGRVSMDMLTVGLDDFPEAEVGDRVVLWGEGLPVEEVANAAGTIPYTLLCGIAARVDTVEAHAAHSSESFRRHA